MILFEATSLQKYFILR